jgi:glycosyltransferase involved in cell wall biosynthesis
MRVLVLVPKLDRRGGIANYYNVVRPHFKAAVDYLWRGSRRRGQPVRNLLWHLYDYVAFARALRRERYDVVHLNTSLGRISCLRDGLFVLIARALGGRVMVFFRGWNEEYRRRMGPLTRAFFRYTFLRADLLVVLAEEFAAGLREMGYPAERIRLETTVVEMGLVAPEDFPPGAADAPVTGGAGLELLFLSRVEKAKGIYGTLEAFTLLKRTHPSLRLTIAGDGRELDGAMRYVRERQLADVTFLGHVAGEAKHAAFRRADVFLFPSHGEGMPNAVLEAMASGLPVVGRAVGGLRDFFEDGRMGYLTDSRNAGVLADLIERVLDDYDARRAMAAYNRRFARERFAADRVVARLESHYQELLPRSAAPASVA